MGNISSAQTPVNAPPTTPTTPINFAEPSKEFILPDVSGITDITTIFYTNLQYLVNIYLNTYDPTEYTEWWDYIETFPYDTNLTLIDNLTKVVATLRKTLYSYIIQETRPGILDPHLLRIAFNLGDYTGHDIYYVMVPQPDTSGLTLPVVPSNFPAIPNERGLYPEVVYVLMMHLVETITTTRICNILYPKTYNINTETYITLAKEQSTIKFTNEELRNMRLCIRNKEIMIIPLTLLLDVNNNIIVHFNVLFVDFSRNTLEHFEPHGNVMYGLPDYQVSDDVNKRIGMFGIMFTDAINSTMNTSLTYIPRDAICPASGPQFLETNTETSGYCTIWGLYLFHLRLLNPNVSLQDLIKYMLSRPTMLYDLIKYRCYSIAQLSTIPLGKFPEYVRYVVRLLDTTSEPCLGRFIL
jgi:hypothetical protein